MIWLNLYFFNCFLEKHFQLSLSCGPPSFEERWDIGVGSDYRYRSLIRAHLGPALPDWVQRLWSMKSHVATCRPWVLVSISRFPFYLSTTTATSSLHTSTINTTTITTYFCLFSKWHYVYMLFKLNHFYSTHTSLISRFT